MTTHLCCCLDCRYFQLRRKWLECRVDPSEVRRLRLPQIIPLGHCERFIPCQPRKEVRQDG